VRHLRYPIIEYDLNLWIGDLLEGAAYLPR